MSVSTTITSAKGVVSQNNATGITLETNSGNQGFAPYATGVTRALTTGVTLSAGDAGVLTLSGAAGALSVVMPSPATCAGALFAFRCTSADPHVLSGSGVAFANGVTLGATLTLSNSIGSSVSLQSDGLCFLVMGNRSALVIA